MRRVQEPCVKKAKMIGNITEYKVTVAQSDIDELNHVNNAVYLKWVQTATLQHWHLFAPEQAIQSHVWVALRHKIRYLRPAFFNELLSVQVQLEKVRGACSFYKTNILRDGEALVKVDSCWVYLNSETRKPERISHELLAHFSK